MQQLLLVAVAVATGMVIPLQPGINAEMRLHTQSAFTASLISFVGGTLVLAVAVVCVRLATRESLPGVGAVVRSAPWWAYLGGLVGALFVTVAVVLAPRLGAAVLVAGIVTGQLIGSVLIDHFALVGFPRVQVTWPRVVGVVLLVAGVFVIQFGGVPGGGEIVNGNRPRVDGAD
ncbi:MAG: DMT family transporter [Planctomycetota bacterium]